MLAKPDVKVAFDESGKAIGVTSEGQTAKAKLVSNASCFLRKQVPGVMTYTPAHFLHHRAACTSDGCQCLLCLDFLEHRRLCATC